jgi:putative membrane protein
VTNRNFTETIEDISKNLGQYVGRTIKVTGFVFNPKRGLGENQFVISRLRITCCMSDASVVGFTSEKEGKFANNDWYRVEGVVGVGTFRRKRIPVIKVERMDRVEAPKQDQWYVN